MGILDRYYERRTLNAMVQSQWAEAERYLLKMMKRRPGVLGLNYNMGVVLLAQKKFDQAEALLTQSIDRFGRSLRLCRLLADIYYYWGKGSSAVSWYHKALEEEPAEKEKKLIQLRLKLLKDEARYSHIAENARLVEEARSLMKSDPAKALELYLEAAEYDPSDIESLNNIGSLYMNHMHQSDKAAAFFRKVLDLVDNQAVAGNLLKAEKEI
ncbi:tetratricopeptide repeat protein [Sediminispirochaeta smaragdinae]|uniref:TPR repeat-containing protein n=1 Tax=Sediminispirochaeta smaragdinae (strain DSM 11293 / JCM 15392 / SEBR 4228) TaxID=573413 RepID=E1RAM2_SEDSS|nr:tetratricopeptide repeat protein [Sediminispirochaeta smaragdinae]ADK82390.1 TPR repeat-containing protein [Sediminispirochaeta smaragdinae DSM 11293]